MNSPDYSSKKLFQQKGMGLFELVVVVVIISILMIYAIDRMQNLFLNMEKVSVLRVIGSLNSAINLQAAERVVEQGIEGIKTLENSNPMDFLSQVPHSYIGLISDQQVEQLPASSWYFDNDKKILGYIVNNKQHFDTALKGVPRARFKVTLLYSETALGGSERIQGIALTNLDEYRWK